MVYGDVGSFDTRTPAGRVHGALISLGLIEHRAGIKPQALADAINELRNALG